jgi:hypothetical protein
VVGGKPAELRERLRRVVEDPTTGAKEIRYDPKESFINALSRRRTMGDIGTSR